MKRNRLNLFACFLIACMVINVSCKKDKGKSRSELLVGNWQFTSDAYSPAYDYTGNGMAVTEAISLHDDCTKDDFVTFNADNTGLTDDGPTKCDPSDEQTYPLAWQLSDNDSKLVLATFGETYTILQLDNSTLKISDTFEENSITYTNTLTLKRK
ncbi:MAG: lipocalin family protein [Bacteroidota bacterium]